MVYGYDDYGYMGYGWGSFQQLMQAWTNLGVFTVLLPLLLIFTIVFAILEKVNLFNNRGVHLIIALVIGFFTISNPYVSGFFMYLFSNLALGIAILLCLLVLVGIALKDEEGAGTWLFGIAGFVLFIFVLARSGALRILIGEELLYWLKMNIALVIIVLVIIGAIAFVWKGTAPETTKKRKAVREMLFGKG